MTKSVILDYQRRPNRYFIWSHVAAVKQVRTFQRVNIVSQAKRTLFRVTSPTAGEIRALERHTKLSHKSLLDYLDIQLSVEPPNSSNGSLTNVYFKAEARASGLIGMFDGVIKRSLQENARALVANIEQ